jgi:hypothetical protein
MFLFFSKTVHANKSVRCLESGFGDRIVSRGLWLPRATIYFCGTRNNPHAALRGSVQDVVPSASAAERYVQ